MSDHSGNLEDLLGFKKADYPPSRASQNGWQTNDLYYSGVPRLFQRTKKIVAFHSKLLEFRLFPGHFFFYKFLTSSTLGALLFVGKKRKYRARVPHTRCHTK